ncbi:MAG: hypothetical protein WBM13_10975 [Bacteroidia bacterium]
MKSELITFDNISGLFWYAQEQEDGSDSPMSLKEFKDSIWRDAPFARLSQAAPLSYNNAFEDQLTLDCVQIENEEESTLKLIFKEDGTIEGRNEFPLYEGDIVEYFRGDYRITSSKIFIWGVLTDDIEFENNLQSIYIELKQLVNNDEGDYNEEDAIEFIRENISYELDDRLTDNEILMLVNWAEDYIDMEFEKNKKRKPFVAFELRTIDQNEINKYVLERATENNIKINIDELYDLLYAELMYRKDIGFVGEDDIVNN